MKSRPGVRIALIVGLLPLLIFVTESGCASKHSTSPVNTTQGEQKMTTLAGAKAMTLPALREARKKLASRPRRIIFNNDGNEPVYYCDVATPETLLACRTTPLLGSMVDSIFYCTWSSGFGVFTHNTKIGEIFTSTANPTHPDNKTGGLSKNKTAEFIRQGTDPLRIMVDFCKANRIEAFWSFRMNDTHDAWGSWYGNLLFPQLKKNHPEWLVSPLKTGAAPASTNVKDYDRSKHGGWTAMDFNHPEVRDLAVRFIAEVCENYDVDGIEMDFLRHAVYFKGPAWGTDATAEELARLTDMVRQVRNATERIGLQRGRPILVAIRVPDSVEYSKAMGIDIERWLADGLVDTMAVSDYFRLNPWSASVELGHKYGVPVYACLSETRLRDTEAAKIRSAPACYRGRAAVAWSEGVDGIYMFNAFNPQSPLWRELGNADGLRGLDKTFVVAARGAQVINFWMADGEKRFLRRAYLSPERPLPLEPGKPASIELRVAGMPVANADLARPAIATLRLRIAGDPGANALVVALNGTPLTGAIVSSPWLDYPVALELVKNGPNRIEVTLNPGNVPKAKWLDVALQVKVLPSVRSGP
ncbi:MAG: family 10 glycosylhydrolase [Kiritimatiellae bacterium]|nr:family 10 glycosylhydrolase [Kiritimatiellia bacterium]MDD5522080.1 family 10 glycosylhydrolase [Kiritimatiellia bacterium]